MTPARIRSAMALVEDDQAFQPRSPDAWALLRAEAKNWQGLAAVGALLVLAVLA